MAFPSGWRYRYLVALSAATPSNNYQIKVVLTPANFDYAHCKANGDDIRFADAANNLFDYWIQEWNEGGTSTLWVEVPASGTSSFYLYTENAAASAVSSGDDTFPLFDDFSGDSLDTTKWDQMNSGTGTITVSGGTITIASAGDWWSTSDTARAIVSKQQFSFNYVFEAFAVKIGADGWDRFMGLRSGVATNAKHFAHRKRSGYNEIGISWRTTVGGSASDSGSGGPAPGSNKLSRIQRINNEITGFYDNILVATKTVEGLNYVALTDSNGTNQPSEFAWIFVRSHDGTDRTATLGSEEVLFAALTASYDILLNTSLAAQYDILLNKELAASYAILPPIADQLEIDISIKPRGGISKSRIIGGV